MSLLLLFRGALTTTGPTVLGSTHKAVSTPASDVIAIPSAAAAGDLALLYCSGHAGETSVASGFTPVGSIITSTGTTESCVGVRVVTSGDVSAREYTVPGSPGFNENHYTLLILHSSLGTPVIDAYVSAEEAGAIADPSVHVFPSATATVNNTTVVLATGTRPQGTTWSAAPAGSIADQSIIGTIAAQWVGHLDKPTAGATGTNSITHDVAYARWTTWTVIVAHPSVSTNAPGSTATGSGTANNASPLISPISSAASGSGSAASALTTIAVVSAAATSTGSASTALPTVAPQGSTAIVTSTANAAVTSIKPVGAVVSASGTGYSGSSNISDGSTAATGSGSSNSGVPRVSPVAGVATATGAALDATATVPGNVSANAVVATASGTANNPSTLVRPLGTTSTATGSSNQAGEFVRPTGSTATGGGSASAPASSVSSIAALATGSGVGNAALPTVSPRSALASGSGSAATPSLAISNRAASTASATGSAQQASLSIAATAAIATAAAVIMLARLIVAVRPSPASGTGTAINPSVTKLVGRRCKVWDGSQWVGVPVKVYDPDLSQWVESSAVKFYDPYARQWKHLIQ